MVANRGGSHTASQCLKSHTKPERLLARWQSVKTWYDHDWMKLDPKLRTSCVEGISSFLSLFDMEDVASIFCPQAPPVEDAAERPKWEPTESGGTWKHLPPLDELIESRESPRPQHARRLESGAGPRRGCVPQKRLAPDPAPAAGTDESGLSSVTSGPPFLFATSTSPSPPLARTIPRETRRHLPSPGSASVIPIVATQSISSLRSVLGTSEAWRALLQTLRTRIFLSLSDDASAEIASKLCGQVAKIKPSWTVTESARQAEVSLLSGKAGGGQGSVGTSKSFREQREALFQPREFALLPNCQAICLPYDGINATSAVRVYLKPYYLPETTPYWRAVEAGKI